jgi:hypothetical protein
VRVDDAVVVRDSNKLTVRLLPCDVLARVAPAGHQVAQFEVEVAQRLAESESPVAALEPRVEPRVYRVMASWSRCGPTTNLRRLERSHQPTMPNALERLHAGMRKLDVPAPHLTDRVEHAQHLVASRDRTPGLADADRELLGNTLRSLRRVIGDRGGAEQLLHGEPHPGNMLTTKNGLLFIDLETCCRGLSNLTWPMRPRKSASTSPDMNFTVSRIADGIPDGVCTGTVFATVATLHTSAGGAGAVEFERTGPLLQFDLLVRVVGDDGTTLQSDCMTIIAK